MFLKLNKQSGLTRSAMFILRDRDAFSKNLCKQTSVCFIPFLKAWLKP